MTAVLLLMLAAAASPAAAADSAAPHVRPIDPKGYVEMVAASKGRILVVNMWATWCDPCREEFPDLVKLEREFAARGLTMVAISLDVPSALDTGVIPFLRTAGVTFPVFIKAAGDDETFINAVDPKWSGVLPATFVYDPEGRLVRSIFGSTSYDRIRGVVTPLLANGPK